MVQPCDSLYIILLLSYTTDVSSLFARLFPIPASFTIPTVGVDFSDATLRFIRLKQGLHGLVPMMSATIAIPEGCMDGGRIIDTETFVAFLKSVRTKYDLSYVRVSIPESQVYSVTLPIDVQAKDDIRGSIELLLEDNVPLKVSETVFDFQVLSSDTEKIVVQVVAVAATVAEGYLEAFNAAGLIPVSFELDGQAIARAVLAPEDKKSCMIVDIGANRTGITIVTKGVAVYTSTLEFGGKTLISLIMKEHGFDESAAHQEIHRGLSATGANKDVFTSLASGISVLKEEIDRRYIYWHEKKDQFGPLAAIDTICLCGGYSTIEGLADYLSASLKIKVIPANPWINCLSFDHEIPTLSHDDAQSYVTAIGLALTDYLYD